MRQSSIMPSRISKSPVQTPKSQTKAPVASKGGTLVSKGWAASDTATPRKSGGPLDNFFPSPALSTSGNRVKVELTSAQIRDADVGTLSSADEIRGMSVQQFAEFKKRMDTGDVALGYDQSKAVFRKTILKGILEAMSKSR